MQDIHEMVRSVGGYARKRELVALGAHDRHLTAVVRNGAVARVRNGWYSTARPTDPAFRALRVGGRLTSASALREQGAWMPATAILHVSVPHNAARLRSQWRRRRRLDATERAGVILHWDGPDVAARGGRTAVHLVDAVVAYVADAPFEIAVAVLDWVTSTGRLDRVDFERLIVRLPKRLHKIGQWVDPNCGSFPESLARTRLRMSGYRVATQVPVGNLESIDLVVEDEIAIEVDGRQFHEGRFERDRRKDLRITRDGRHSIRITYQMLMQHWIEIEFGVVAALRARGHPPRRRQSTGPTRAVAATPTSLIGRKGAMRLPELPAVEGGR